MANVKLVIVNVMQKHINPAQVVGGQVNLLPVETHGGLTRDDLLVSLFYKGPTFEDSKGLGGGWL